MHELYRDNLNAGYHLPLHYGEDRMILMLRDPYWLFSYWEITGGTQNYYRQKYHQSGWDNSTPIIRVYRFPVGLEPLDQPEITFDIELSHNINSWHINVGMPNRRYYAEIGRKLPGGEYIPILCSNSVNTPRDSESDIIDEKWRLFSLQQRIYRRMTMYHLSSAELQSKGIDPEEFETCNDSHIKII
ncbi:DUF4912 domain-containing protein [Candidatus Contubernalis alkaliaceticus]|uniref:DUF4912 domain-containing protein n=1 Tax=Candidatus Contubernalis alkaliaceticus TaxID=338645 RepID=UPI001F4BDAFC|nr:DUF4912 domain-containing protein [Candidatus Contubernalis alkalaceticus]UNC93258.1 DUF4912 domain-containing protein [Candidatus Contubernalis alkalaceticus]